MEAATVTGLTTESVQRFCAAHNLMVTLESALRLTESVFASVDPFRVDVETDPETEEQTIAIEIAVKKGIEDAAARKREYTRQSVEQSSPRARGEIRLVYDLIPNESAKTLRLLRRQYPNPC